MAPPTFAVDHVRTAKCLEPLCLAQALLLPGWYPAPPRRALPLLHRSYELMRQTSSLLRTSCIHTYFQRSLQVAASPCWVTGSSRRYLCKSFPGCLSHGSRRVGRVHLPVTSPALVGLPQIPPMGRLPRIAPQRDFMRWVFRDRRYSLRSGLLVCSPPRSPLPLRRSSPRRAAVTFTPEQKIRTVTSAGIGHASRPNQAIDGKRTFTFLDSQPCRPPSWDLHPLIMPAFAGRTVSQYRSGETSYKKTLDNLRGGGLADRLLLRITYGIAIISNYPSISITRPVLV